MSEDTARVKPSLNFLLGWQIMKASLFAEDEEESDMFQDHGVKVSADVSSPRLITPGVQSRPSGSNAQLLFPPPSLPSLSLILFLSSSSSIFLPMGVIQLPFLHFLLLVSPLRNLSVNSLG